MRIIYARRAWTSPPQPFSAPLRSNTILTEIGKALLRSRNTWTQIQSFSNATPPSHCSNNINWTEFFTSAKLLPSKPPPNTSPIAGPAISLPPPRVPDLGTTGHATSPHSTCARTTGPSWTPYRIAHIRPPTCNAKCKEPCGNPSTPAKSPSHSFHHTASSPSAWSKGTRHLQRCPAANLQCLPQCTSYLERSSHPQRAPGPIHSPSSQDKLLPSPP
jgi:hypothetical protein